MAGLKRDDFRLLDNSQPQEIVAFHASEAASASGDDSPTIIILLDTLNLPSDQALFERQQVAQFLRQHAGKLAQPVTIYSLEDSGFFLTAKPSTDGEVLATDVTSDNKVEAYFLAPHPNPKLKAVVEPLFLAVPALTGLRSLWIVATAQVKRPGRKLLFWIGPGLGTSGTGAFSPDGVSLLSTAGRPFGAITSDKKGEEAKRQLFQNICWFSLLLRQARITLDCFATDEDKPEKNPVWSGFIAPVLSSQQASWMNLFKNVLAVQSGGRVLSSPKSLVGLMDDCAKNISIVYSLTFDPPVAAHTDEYRSVKVELTQPTLAAKTSAGYYNQPFYNDTAQTGVQRVTVAQLEQILLGMHGGASGARQLSSLVSTERIGKMKLQSLLQELHDKKLRETLEVIAYESTFLNPAAAELSIDPAPDLAEQQRILKTAADYLDRVIPKLPDFFATRTAVYYREGAPHPGVATGNGSEHLHAEKPRKETVLYRRGEQVLSQTSSHPRAEGQSLRTYGTFGPILKVLQFVSSSPGDVSWDRWEKSDGGRRAVFRYRIARTPTLNLSGCCYPNGNKGARIEFSSDSHGEIAIDPSTGAILRVQMESELPSFVPSKRSDMMVSYGPVEIGGKVYIVPLRSVNLWKGRSAVWISQWNAGFATWGQYETQMNVFTFDQYHMFRGSARVLPGFEHVH